jgi:hypothetical protein
MTIRFSDGEEPPVDLLAATEGLYRETAEELVRAVRVIRAGRADDVKAATQAVKDLRSALQMVMEERTRVEKLRRQVAGTVGAGTLDLDAARDEVGRRLARLRDAGPGG